MNLHGIVRSAITAVNPDVTATLRRSNGYSTLSDGTQVPAYTEVAGIVVQVQALTYSDLQHLDGLNIQGVRRAIYLNGAAMGVVRNLQVGGDVFVFPAGTMPEGSVWLVAHIIEQWGPGAEWCKACITTQNGA